MRSPFAARRSPLAASQVVTDPELLTSPLGEHNGAGGAAGAREEQRYPPTANR